MWALSFPKVLKMFADYRKRNVKIHRMQQKKDAGGCLDKCKCCGKGSKETGLARCSGCFLIFYCGGDCQKNNWKSHKKVCREIWAQIRPAKIKANLSVLLQSVDNKMMNKMPAISNQFVVKIQVIEMLCYIHAYVNKKVGSIILIIFINFPINVTMILSELDCFTVHI